MRVTAWALNVRTIAVVLRLQALPHPRGFVNVAAVWSNNAQHFHDISLETDRRAQIHSRKSTVESEKSFLFCKSSLPQPFLFLLQDSLYGFPRLFTVTSEHIRLFTFSVFTLFSCRFRAVD